MTFGDRLREARKAKGFTQEALAELIGVAKSTLTGYEKGNREPDMFKIKKLIDILEVDSDYLLGIERLQEIEKPATNKDDGLNDLQREALNAMNQLDRVDMEIVKNLAVSLAKKHNQE